jgi:hypothetical protein
MFSLDVDTSELRKTRSAENVFSKPKIVIDQVSVYTSSSILFWYLISAGFVRQTKAEEEDTPFV